MRGVWFLAIVWLSPFLFFGWRVWLTWPSKQERERQREASWLYDHHFGRQSHGTNRQIILLPTGSRKTNATHSDLWFRIWIIEILSVLLALFVIVAFE